MYSVRASRTFFQILHVLADRLYDTAGLVPAHHWLFQNEVTDSAVSQIVDVGSANSDVSHFQKYFVISRGRNFSLFLRMKASYNNSVDENV